MTDTRDTVASFLDRVGRSNFERNLGHSTQVVSRALAKNQFPAHWFFSCRDWCAEIGIEVPEHLFRQNVGAADASKQNADRSAA
ncbi:hypothetical protein [Pseudooceanicola atlanticus]|nr:hypothetical protein [Pseudooceanicola atlanticus]